MPDPSPNGLPIPKLQNEGADLPVVIRALAESIDERYGGEVDATDDLAAVASPFVGMAVWVTDEKQPYVFDGSVWRAAAWRGSMNRSKATTQTITRHASNYYDITWPDLGYDRGGVIQYGSPLAAGIFRYVGLFPALIRVHGMVEWEDNSSANRIIRVHRSADLVSWSRWGTWTERGAISQLFDVQVYMEPGWYLKMDAGNRHASADLTLGGDTPSSRISLDVEPY